jgi:hypothetical protein
LGIRLSESSPSYRRLFRRSHLHPISSSPIPFKFDHGVASGGP